MLMAFINNVTITGEIRLGFHGGEDRIHGFLGCCAIYSGTGHFNIVTNT
jgi:hypothetical protein